MYNLVNGLVSEGITNREGSKLFDTVRVEDPLVWLDGRRTGIGAEGCGTDIGGGTLSRVEPLGDPERDAAPFLTGTVGAGDGTRCDVSELF